MLRQLIQNVRSKKKLFNYMSGSTLKSAQFFTQAFVAQKIINNEALNNIDTNKLPGYLVILSKIKTLFLKDYESIQSGHYLGPDNTYPNQVEFFKKSIETTIDLFSVKKRVKTKKTQVFHKETKPDDIPDYFNQTFHYQTDGYLSERSADLYDFQVESVFSGCAEIMRRRALLPIHKWIKSYTSNNKEIKMIDVACGTGSYTKLVSENHPAFHLTGLDLSSWYLKKAQERYSHIHFVKGKAEKLPFEDNSLDIVSNIFLFHELPPAVRTTALKEFKRVLKPGGLLIHVDSIQKDDDIELNGALEIFPKAYHEPFYLGYVNGAKIEDQLDELNFEKISSEKAFFSKITSAVKK